MNGHSYQLSRRKAFGVIGAALVLPSVGRADSVASSSGSAFGTSWQITAEAGTDLSRLASDIELLFSDIDQTFSPWRSDSVISRFNIGSAGKWTADPELTEVVATALDIARKSEGAFDPTVGPLVGRWGFGPINRGGAPDWRQVSVGARGLSKMRADVTLDLCGIAKGWALDRAVAMARASGMEGLLLELGGEIAALGRHPSGRDWRVAVDAPPTLAGRRVTLRLPSGTAVATSGVWAQSYALNGRLYSHIIDPSAGSPIAGALRSVTVVADDAMTADGWATALCAAGAEDACDLALANDVAALLLIESGGELSQVSLGSIHEFLL